MSTTLNEDGYYTLDLVVVNNTIELNNNPVAMRGLSAYDTAKDNGFEGDEIEWLESLRATLDWSSTNW